MSAKIRRRDRETASGQGFGGSMVSPAVLDEAVDDDHFPARLGGREPTPFEERKAVACGEGVFDYAGRHTTRFRRTARGACLLL